MTLKDAAEVAHIREVHVVVACGHRYEHDVDGVPVISNKKISAQIRADICPDFVICHEQDYPFVKGWNCEIIHVVKFLDGSELEDAAARSFANLCAAYDSMLLEMKRQNFPNSGIFVIANPILLGELTSLFSIPEYHLYLTDRSDRRGTRFNEDKLVILEQFKDIVSVKTIALKNGESFRVNRFKAPFMAQRFLNDNVDFAEEPSTIQPLGLRSVFLIEGRGNSGVRLCLDKVVSWAPSRVSRTFQITTTNGEHVCRYETKDERDEGLRRFDKAMSDFFNQE